MPAVKDITLFFYKQVDNEIISRIRNIMEDVETKFIDLKIYFR